jgi:hypothetical protein
MASVRLVRRAHTRSPQVAYLGSQHPLGSCFAPWPPLISKARPHTNPGQGELRQVMDGLRERSMDAAPIAAPGTANRLGRRHTGGRLLIRDVEVQAAACRNRTDQGLQLAERGRLGPCGPPALQCDPGESQARTARSALTRSSTFLVEVPCR